MKLLVIVRKTSPIYLFEIQTPLHRRLLTLTRLLNFLKHEIYLQNT